MSVQVLLGILCATRCMRMADFVGRIEMCGVEWRRLDFDIFIQSIFKFMTCTLCLCDGSAGTRYRCESFTWYYVYAHSKQYFIPQNRCNANENNNIKWKKHGHFTARCRPVIRVHTLNKEHVDHRNCSETIIIFWANSLFIFFFVDVDCAAAHNVSSMFIFFLYSLRMGCMRCFVCCIESRRRRFAIEFLFSLFQ